MFYTCCSYNHPQLGDQVQSQWKAKIAKIETEGLFLVLLIISTTFLGIISTEERKGIESSCLFWENIEF
jgi:hypothetical protein